MTPPATASGARSAARLPPLPELGAGRPPVARRRVRLLVPALVAALGLLFAIWLRDRQMLRLPAQQFLRGAVFSRAVSDRNQKGVWLRSPKLTRPLIRLGELRLQSWRSFDSGRATLSARGRLDLRPLGGPELEYLANGTLDRRQGVQNLYASFHVPGLGKTLILRLNPEAHGPGLRLSVEGPGVDQVHELPYLEWPALLLLCPFFPPRPQVAREAGWEFRLPVDERPGGLPVLRFAVGPPEEVALESVPGRPAEPRRRLYPVRLETLLRGGGLPGAPGAPGAPGGTGFTSEVSGALSRLGLPGGSGGPGGPGFGLLIPGPPGSAPEREAYQARAWYDEDGRPLQESFRLADGTELLLLHEPWTEASASPTPAPTPTERARE